MEIRPASENDLSAVAETYTELLTYEAEHGSHSNWQLNKYPTRSTAENAFRNGWLYVLIDAEKLCASMILNQNQLDSYAHIRWEYPAAPQEVLVIHTLCIPPSCAGKGYGTAMVRWAGQHARVLGCRVIRLDTWAGNQPAAELYTKLGFRYAGIQKTLFQGVIPEELVFFEFSLDQSA